MPGGSFPNLSEGCRVVDQCEVLKYMDRLNRPFYRIIHEKSDHEAINANKT
jgi:hypothetical protein